MKNPPLLFLDIECIGLDIDAPIWDLGAILVDEQGQAFPDRRVNLMIKHDPGDRVQDLPPSFQDDYESRYDESKAFEPSFAMRQLLTLITPGTVVCGSNPHFDMERIRRLSDLCGYGDPLWHYHPEDIPTLARGWLNGKGIFPAPPWKSDFISQACGVDVRDFDRHTAYGDASWCLALYRKVMGQ